MRLDLTPKAVATALRDAGIVGSFTIGRLPVTHEDRVGIYWTAGPYDDRYVHEPEPHLAACATTLEAAGYQTEFVADQPAGYLVVWLEGEF